MRAAWPTADTEDQADGKTGRRVRPSPFPRTRGWGLALAFSAAVVSGVAIFVNGYGVKSFGGASSVYTTVKNLVAAVVLLGLAVAMTRRRSEEGLSRPQTGRQRAGLIAVAVVGGSVPFLLFFEGLSRASSVQAAFIQKTLVVWVALLALPLLRERIGPLHLAAIGLLLAGQALLQGGVDELQFGTGEAMILGATILWAIEVVMAKRLLGSLSSLTVATARMGLGIIVLVGYLAATGTFGDLLWLTARQWGWGLLTGAILAVYVATWYAALARAQAVDVTAVLVFGAVITALLAGSVQGAALRPQSLGLGLVALGTTAVIGATRLARVGAPPAGSVTS